MAICRFGATSDVHVLYTDDGGLDCCSCVLSARVDFKTCDERAMITHLKAHQSAGHQVPPDALEQLFQRSQTALKAKRLTRSPDVRPI